jgi:hypothetical protein
VGFRAGTPSRRRHRLLGIKPGHPVLSARESPGSGDGSVERGTETYEVTVRVLTGAERDRIYAEQGRRYPGFAEYERQTAGVRTIPVLELTRT